MNPSNKFDLCYYGQVNSLRLQLSVASEWQMGKWINTFGVSLILLAMAHPSSVHWDNRLYNALNTRFMTYLTPAMKYLTEIGSSLPSSGFPPQVMANKAASRFVSGVAVHWYLDWVVPASVLDKTRQLFPSVPILYTEACTGEWVLFFEIASNYSKTKTNWH